MIALRLTESWYGREDISLTDKLMAELPGILQWAIRGWQKLQKRGSLLQPDSGEEVVRELEDLSSPVGAFVRERCATGPGHHVPRSELFIAYQEWCQEKGRVHVQDEAGFGRDLRAVLPKIGTSHPRIGGERVRCHVGISLTGG